MRTLTLVLLLLVIPGVLGIGIAASNSSNGSIESRNGNEITEKMSLVGIPHSEQVASQLDKKIVRKVFDLGTGRISNSKNDLDSKVRTFLSTNTSGLGINPDDLLLSSSYIAEKQEPLSILKYTQTYKGLPVHSSSVIVGIRDGKVVTLKSNYYPQIDINIEPALGEAGILEVVKKDVGVPVRKGFPKAINIRDLQSRRSENATGKNSTEKQTNVEGLSLVIYPRKTNAGIDYHLAYKVELGLIRFPPAKWVYIIDANNGEILEKYNRVVYNTLNGTAAGSVYPESPSQSLVTRNFSNMTLFNSQTSSSSVFWSGKGDNITNYIITKNPISLSGVSSTTLEFKTKYSIEEGYDFGYALISTDGSNFSWYEKYTGNLTNWSTRRIDLTSLAGQQIWIAFLYQTDSSVQYDGMYIDDIKIVTNLGTRFNDPGNSFTNWNNNGFNITTQNVESYTALGNTSSNGSYSLSGLPDSFILHSELFGPYAHAYNLSGINEYLNINVNTPSTQDIDWGTYDTSYKNEQSNVYYHVNRVHDFFIKGSPFNIYSMNYQTTAYVQYPDTCNAFSDGRDIYLFGAGGGCEATSLFSDIIYHEYTHSVVDHVYTTPLPYVNESGALNEGWADYFAGTINGNPCMDDFRGGICLRNLTDIYRYPDDIVGEVHDDSRIVSGAAWDLRQELGNTTSDGLIINAMKLEPFNFTEYLDDIIVADDNNSNLADGTPHLYEICYSFYNVHGILSPYCIGVNLTVDTTAKTTNAGINATYTLTLTNTGTATDTYNLTVTNPNRASVAALNITGNITLASSAVRVLTLNVTNTSAGIFHVNVTARSNNDTSKFMYINTTTTVPSYGVNLSVDSAVRTTITGVNATYTLTLKNNGNKQDTFNLTLDNPNSASVAALNVSGDISLEPSAVRVLKLNVTNTTNGTFHVNVTARSNNDTSKFMYVNTTTIANTYAVNLTVDLASRTAILGTNATYTLILMNNGTTTDTYNLTVTNVDGASVAALNRSGNITVAQGAVQMLLLNVTGPTPGYYRVNVTARSNNDTSKFMSINTTTIVQGYNVNLTVDSAARTTISGVNATYTLFLQNKGTETDTFNLTVDNPNNASIAALNVSEQITLASNAVMVLALNVTNTTVGKFNVNVTARSNNDTSKFMYINTTTSVLVVITITNPANNTITNSNFVNVTATLDNIGTAHLYWQGINYSMSPNTSQTPGTVFYRNMTGLLSDNYSFRVYADDVAGNTNLSELRTVNVNLINTTNISDAIDNSTGNLSQDIILISPSGNAVVTIFNGTNATVNGNAIGNISIDSPAQINATVSGLDRFAGENLTLGPAIAQFIPDIQMRFNYTDAQLTAAGITDAGTLRIRLYNTTSGTYSVLTYTLNTTGKYIIANASTFGAFALVGTAPSGCISNCGGSSSGGGGGGGGGTSGENFSNIELKEKYDESIFKDKVTAYMFKNASNPVLFVNITGNVSAGLITTMVEVLRGTSALVKEPAPGTVYKNVNVWVGTSGFAVPKNIHQGVIRFRVESTWLDSKSLSAGDIRLVKWNKTQWVQLETAEKDKDNTYTYFEARTDSFSSFAITGLKGEAAPTATSAIDLTETQSAPTPPITPKKNYGFEVILAITILCSVYLLRRKRR